MDALGWTYCDIIIVTGDAYVDHPSFGMAIIGRCWRHRGSGWASSPSRIGTARGIRGVGRAAPVFGVTGATWIRW